MRDAAPAKVSSAEKRPARRQRRGVCIYECGSRPRGARGFNQLAGDDAAPSFFLSRKTVGCCARAHGARPPPLQPPQTVAREREREPWLLLHTHTAAPTPTSLAPELIQTHVVVERRVFAHARHVGAAQQRALKVRAAERRPLALVLPKRRVGQQRVDKRRAAQVGTVNARAKAVGVVERRAGQIGRARVGARELRADNARVGQLGAGEVDAAKDLERGVVRFFFSGVLRALVV